MVPSHDRALIKRGVLLKPPPSLATSSSSSKPAHLPEDPSARAALRRSQKLKAGPVRLSSAREGALDYEFGGRKNKSAWLEDDGEDHLKRNSEKGMGKEEEGHGEEGGKLLEVRMGAGDEDLGAGWGSLVELRIEVRSRASSSLLTTVRLGRTDADPSYFFLRFREPELKDSSRTSPVLGNLSRKRQTLSIPFSIEPSEALLFLFDASLC